MKSTGNGIQQGNVKFFFLILIALKDNWLSKVKIKVMHYIFITNIKL